MLMSVLLLTVRRQNIWLAGWLSPVCPLTSHSNCRHHGENLRAIQKSLPCIRLISFAETTAFYVDDIHLNLCRFPLSLAHSSLFFLSFSASFSRFFSTCLQQNTDTGSVNNTFLTGYIRFSQWLEFVLRSSGL